MNQYLREFRQRLSHYGINASGAVQFYSGYLRDGNFKTYQQCVDELGSPKTLARQTAAKILINQPSSRASVKSNAKTIWLVILAIISSPITVPVAGSLLIGLIIIIATLMFSLVIALVSLIAGTLGTLAFGASLLVRGLFASGSFYCFASLAGIGLWLIMFTVIEWAFSWLIYGIKKLSRRIYLKHLRKKRMR